MSELSKALKLLDKNEKSKIYILLLIMIILSFLEFFSLGGVLIFLNYFILEGSQENISGILSKLDSNIFSETNLVFLSIVIIFIFFFKNSLTILNVSFSTNVLNSIRINISRKLYKGYLTEDIIGLQKRNLSTYLRNINYEGHAFTLYLKEYLNYILQFLTLFFILILSLLYNFKISLFIFSIFGLLFFFYFKYFKKTLTLYGEKRASISKSLLNLINQTFLSIREIKIYNLENKFINEFVKENTDLKRISARRSVIGNFPKVFWELVLVSGVFLSIIYFESIGRNMNETIGLFSTYVIIAIRLIPSFSQLGQSKNSLEYAKSSVNIFYDNEMYIKKNSKQLEILETKKEDFKINELKINDLSFSFKGINKKIFDTTNLKLSKGDFVCIYGENGTGKTTFFDIITGLIKPDSLNLYINDVKINDLKNHINFSYIAQNSFIFDDTLENNILLNKNKKLENINTNKILKISDLTNLINSLPEKEKTIIGENGVQLSGGEKQKISIARALYNNPKLLLTDEFTNAIDEKSEIKILNELKEYKELDIFIMISHNRNLEHMFNKVYELKNQKFERVK